MWASNMHPMNNPIIVQSLCILERSAKYGWMKHCKSCSQLTKKWSIDAWEMALTDSMCDQKLYIYSTYRSRNKKSKPRTLRTSPRTWRISWVSSLKITSMRCLPAMNVDPFPNWKPLVFHRWSISLLWIHPGVATSHYASVYPIL